MKTDFERAFIRAGRRGQRLLQDDLIALVPREYAGHVAQLGGAKSLVFDIVMPGLSPGPAGEIALRVGEDASLFYLGHIGKSSAQDHFSPDSAAAPSYDSGGAALVDIVG